MDAFLLKVESNERSQIMRVQYLFSIFMIFATTGQVSALEETEYYALFMGGKKIGYEIQSRETDGEKVTTTQEISMQVSRAGTPVKLNTTETDIETTDGKPLGFKVVQDLGATRTIISGTVNELWIVNIIVTQMGKKQEKMIGWPSGAIMNEGLRLLQLEKGLKEGLEYSAKIFNPGSLQAIDVIMHIGPKQKVDLLGRVVTLTEVKTTFKIPAGGEIVSTSYVNEGLRVQKSVSPMLGAQMEMIACAKEFALGENDVLELVDKMFLASPEPLNNIDSAKSITYHLKSNDQTKMLTIPSTDNQSVQQLKEGGVIVTVRPAVPDEGVKFPYEGKDSNILEATKPTSFVQSDNNDIAELAKRAVGDTKDAAEAVKKIESFVSGYIENKGLSVGYASAAEVAASKAGDCTEFAVLTAAMCRATGIPARIVFGLTYVKAFDGKENVFGGHAWVEAYVGDKWIGLDATRTPKGFDAGHIALAIGNGEPADFFNLATTLGQFKIEKVTINKE
jgi:hypothetical protein